MIPCTFPCNSCQLQWLYSGIYQQNHKFKYSQQRIAEISLVGRLRSGISFMKYKGASKFSISVMEKGYTIPFHRNPPGVFLKNNASSRAKVVFVQNEIDKLISSGAVLETIYPATVTNPLSVASKDGKDRLVLDLRHVNSYIRESKCKLEGMAAFLNTVQTSGFFISFDLKSGYHHIQINPAQHQFLGFSYPDHSG